MPQTLDDLMRELQFDHSDLEANRYGELGENQRTRLRQMRMRYLIGGIGVMLGISIVAALFFYWGISQDNPILNIIALAVIFFDALGMTLLGRHYALLSAELSDGTIETFEGEIERVIRPQGRRAGQYLLRIDDAEFYVPKEVFKHFIHQARYRVYCSPRTRTLLAAELIEER
ncbi:MAG: hypothetical protein D6712_03290 [Chloroflexi bacterium]|nr:MAG: hypothetical protein D6712_03290 [Chloroflexota bacterium]